jgi:hypothetical protein
MFLIEFSVKMKYFVYIKPLIYTIYINLKIYSDFTVYLVRSIEKSTKSCND